MGGRCARSGAIGQVPGALLDPEGPRPYQGVLLYGRQTERVRNPYEKVHGYPSSLTRYEVLQEKGTVTGMPS